ncbi:alkaline phosphatase [Ureibacillus sinduriensis]|uniref:Alkaline phosphatase n=1 Tax=Ureibacillus sinduriensis BLB-1 = JCM 15800 TaxID=1384057 RepID=A0A0A3HTU2_9BACL|nr:alkaline phosphatase [Ureibacillus sinduriensis]KGR75834.1 alkaline phosphatase [Ureibacillus sinduriensis BLB-1 = JCM 15800]
MPGLQKKWLSAALVGAAAISSLSVAPVSAEETENKTSAKNVIMLVMDGSSDNVSTIARWYKGESLALDNILTGAVRTYSAESAITDSAPAGTALATGNKSNSGYVGVLPSLVTTPGVEAVAQEDAFKPVANVLEGAKKSGRATGIVSTSEIQHATPAAFSSHVKSRSNYDDIAEQQVFQNIDVVLGGGSDPLNKSRKDGDDLLTVIEEKEYDYVTTRDELLSSDSNKIWGSFAPKALAYELDREKTNPEQPSLAEMTGKAIDTLSKDQDGFFLMVEGSKIDWAAHANDPIGMVTDFLEFDEAVAEALEFAEKDGETLVIAVTDHGNSGITIGNTNTDSTYDTTPVSAYIDPLKEATMTVEGALSLLKEDKSNLAEVAASYGLKDLTADELQALQTSEDVGTTLVKLLSTRANIGFTTGGHTGDDVFLYSFGPSRPTGLVDNTDLALTMAGAMGFNLDNLTQTLFVDAKAEFEKLGFTTQIDTTNENNPVFVAKNNDRTIIIPENRNTVTIQNGDSNGNTRQFDSVAVYNDEKFFISEEMLNFAKQ